MKIFKKPLNIIFDIPTPKIINLIWNFGSLIGLNIFFQTLSGWILSIHYIANYDLSFLYYKKISIDLYYGWIFQVIHINFVSIIFFYIFFHILKALINNSFKKTKVWASGFLIYILLLFSAFIGYVLPWGQISFWGATVITNIFSAIPYFGKILVNWLWGNFSVRNETLNRFFSFHFLFPLIILIATFFHLLFLHERGSSNQLGIKSSKDIINFDKSFISKDLLSLFFFFFIYFSFIFLFISFHFLIAKENFIEVDPLNTPTHIKPEWYFIFIYATLRCIPNKVGGIIIILIIFIIFFSLTLKKNIFFSKFFFLKKINISMFSLFFLFLSCIGYKEIEEPYLILTLIISIIFITSIILI